MRRLFRGLAVLVFFLAAAAYARVPAFIWARPSVASAPAGPEGDLIRRGEDVFARTYAYFGPFADGSGAGYAGNNLACANCHLDAGRAKYAFLLVGATNTYPKALKAGGPVVSLDERINQCMTRSMAGRPVPGGEPAFQALRAYLVFLSAGIPPGVFMDGAGRVAIDDPPLAPDAARGARVFAEHCAKCHRPDGLGARRGGAGTAYGYAFPPLWGGDSFAADAGLADLKTIAGFVHANMPAGVDRWNPRLSVQQAYDVGRFVLSHDRPRGISTPQEHLNAAP